MIIELYGLPGSGKTSLAAELTKTDDVRNVTIGLLGKLLFSLLYHLLHPGRATFLLRQLKAHTRQGLFGRIFAIYLADVARYQKARVMQQLSPGKVYLVDEGHFQLCASTFEREDARVRDYLDCLPAPDLLVCLHAPVTVRRSRMRHRGRTPMMHRGEETYMMWSEQLMRVDENIRAWARPRAYCVELDSTASTQSLAASIRTRISKARG